ncbi:metallopeptidase TldD-related protein [Bdellovibrio sp. HCB288]|uniref:metallopeptidase TldD-related protein n=1 Tax=Bdellovibrio sp. HCB288 TaxID=3394355 RepID=UPI0039B46F1C
MQHDILTLSTDKAEMKAQGNRITSLQTQKIQKSAARIFKNGQIFSSAVVGATTSEILLEKAERPGNMGISYDYELPKTAALLSHLSPKQAREMKLAAFKSFFEDLCKDYPQLNFSGRFAVEKLESSFKSSYTGTLESSGEKNEGYLLYKRFGSTDFAEGFFNLDGETPDFVEIRKKYEPILQAVSLTSSIESKKMPVLIFDYDDIIQRITKDIKPSKFHGKSSYLSGKLGDSFFSSQVTLKDLSFDPEKGFFDRFDGEGVLHENPTVFDKGVFTNVLYDLRQAKKSGKQSTGNGRRYFDTGINCVPHNLTLMAGQAKAWDMIKDIPECLVLVASYGGSISEQWEFSNPVQVGMLFRHGKAVGRVPSVSVKGMMKDILGKDLIGISSDTYSFTQSPAILTQLEVISH